ncbi:unnamed protein product [Caenorhabditis auriculariae]|uniref:ARID domain-containing protein n=2 Tax=Rhabditida TaxID=6236 RepID=A0A8S1GR56_9PELO|nr:unnamed protein product [Caenorhabditis auriculariae]
MALRIDEAQLFANLPINGKTAESTDGAETSETAEPSSHENQNSPPPSPESALNVFDSWLVIWTINQNIRIILGLGNFRSPLNLPPFLAAALQQSPFALQQQLLGLASGLSGVSPGPEDEDEDHSAAIEPEDLTLGFRKEHLKSEDHTHENSSNGGGPTWSYEEQFKQLYELSDDLKRKRMARRLAQFLCIESPVTRIPIMAKQVLDLYELYRLVVQHGGLVEIINKKLWREITKGLNLPSSITSAAFTLRTQYQKFLYEYECEKEGLSNPTDLQQAIDGNKREAPGRRNVPTSSFTLGFPLPHPHSAAASLLGKQLNGLGMRNDLVDEDSLGLQANNLFAYRPDQQLALFEAHQRQFERAQRAAEAVARQTLGMPSCVPTATSGRESTSSLDSEAPTCKRAKLENGSGEPSTAPKIAPPTSNNVKITTRKADGGTSSENSMVVSMEINGITYQGVLFAIDNDVKKKMRRIVLLHSKEDRSAEGLSSSYLERDLASYNFVFTEEKNCFSCPADKCTSSFLLLVNSDELTRLHRTVLFQNPNTCCTIARSVAELYATRKNDASVQVKPEVATFSCGAFVETSVGAVQTENHAVSNKSTETDELPKPTTSKLHLCTTVKEEVADDDEITIVYEGAPSCSSRNSTVHRRFSVKQEPPSANALVKEESDIFEDMEVDAQAPAQPAMQKFNSAEGFAFFSCIMRMTFARENPGSTYQLFHIDLEAEWEKLTDDEKKRYEDKAKGLQTEAAPVLAVENDQTNVLVSEARKSVESEENNDRNSTAVLEPPMEFEPMETAERIDSTAVKTVDNVGTASPATSHKEIPTQPPSSGELQICKDNSQSVASVDQHQTQKVILTVPQNEGNRLVQDQAQESHPDVEQSHASLFNDIQQKSLVVEKQSPGTAPPQQPQTTVPGIEGNHPEQSQAVGIVPIPPSGKMDNFPNTSGVQQKNLTLKTQSVPTVAPSNILETPVQMEKKEIGVTCSLTKSSQDPRRSAFFSPQQAEQYPPIVTERMLKTLDRKTFPKPIRAFENAPVVPQRKIQAGSVAQSNSTDKAHPSKTYHHLQSEGLAKPPNPFGAPKTSGPAFPATGTMQQRCSTPATSFGTFKNPSRTSLSISGPIKQNTSLFSTNSQPLPTTPFGVSKVFGGPAFPATEILLQKNSKIPGIGQPQLSQKTTPITPIIEENFTEQSEPRSMTQAGDQAQTVQNAQGTVPIVPKIEKIESQDQIAGQSAPIAPFPYSVKKEIPCNVPVVAQKQVIEKRSSVTGQPPQTQKNDPLERNRREKIQAQTQRPVQALEDSPIPPPAKKDVVHNVAHAQQKTQWSALSPEEKRRHSGGKVSESLKAEFGVKAESFSLHTAETAPLVLKCKSESLTPVPQPFQRLSEKSSLKLLSEPVEEKTDKSALVDLGAAKAMIKSLSKVEKKMRRNMPDADEMQILARISREMEKDPRSQVSSHNSPVASGGQREKADGPPGKAPAHTGTPKGSKNAQETAQIVPKLSKQTSSASTEDSLNLSRKKLRRAAYKLFGSEIRKRIEEKNPTASSDEVSQKVRNKWKELPEESKQKFVSAAREKIDEKVEDVGEIRGAAVTCQPSPQTKVRISAPKPNEFSEKVEPPPQQKTTEHHFAGVKRHLHEEPKTISEALLLDKLDSAPRRFETSTTFLGVEKTVSDSGNDAPPMKKLKKSAQGEDDDIVVLMSNVKNPHSCHVDTANLIFLTPSNQSSLTFLLHSLLNHSNMSSPSSLCKPEMGNNKNRKMYFYTGQLTRSSSEAVPDDVRKYCRRLQKNFEPRLLIPFKLAGYCSQVTPMEMFKFANTPDIIERVRRRFHPNAWRFRHFRKNEKGELGVKLYGHHCSYEKLRQMEIADDHTLRIDLTDIESTLGSFLAIQRCSRCLDALLDLNDANQDVDKIHAFNAVCKFSNWVLSDESENFLPFDYQLHDQYQPFRKPDIRTVRKRRISKRKRVLGAVLAAPNLNSTLATCEPEVVELDEPELDEKDLKPEKEIPIGQREKSKSPTEVSLKFTLKIRKMAGAMFEKKVRKEVEEQNPGATFHELAEKVRLKWKSVSEDERTDFRKAAAESILKSHEKPKSEPNPGFPKKTDQRKRKSPPEDEPPKIPKMELKREEEDDDIMILDEFTVSNVPASKSPAS